MSSLPPRLAQNGHNWGVLPLSSGGENGISGALGCRTRPPTRVSASQAPWHNSAPYPSRCTGSTLKAQPQKVGRVDRLALVEGALLATVQH